MPKKWVLCFLGFLAWIAAFSAQAEFRKGIYVSQSSLEQTDYLNYLIENSKAVGIDTFVVDLNKSSKLYEKNIALLKDQGIRYVVRIVVFPEGGTDAEIKSRRYWENKYQLIEKALGYGAEEVQLDYIRYKHTQKPSPQNAKNVLQVIEFFKHRLAEKNIPLQIDVFGISSFGASKYIGQDIQLFAHTVDALCPMLYPSHFEPHKVYSIQPYQAISKSLSAIKKQFNGTPPFKVYAYIEMANYRYKFSEKNHLGYIQAQIDATRDAGINGWYAWSANNYYDRLFYILKQAHNKPQFNVREEFKKLNTEEVKLVCSYPLFRPTPCLNGRVGENTPEKIKHFSSEPVVLESTVTS